MASPVARDTSLKLRPDLAKGVRGRVRDLNLTMSSYVAVLIWNQYVAPVSVAAVAEPKRTVRVAVPCYFRRAIAPIFKRIAKDAKLSENALGEALIERDLRNPTAPLQILPRR